MSAKNALAARPTRMPDVSSNCAVPWLLSGLDVLATEIAGE